MARFRVAVEDGQVTAMLREVERSLTDFRPAMDKIGKTLADKSRLSFVRQQSPWDSPWAKLSPTTQARRRKGKSRGSNKALRDTGRLMNSISHKLTGAHSVAIGSDVIYAGTHQFGAYRGQYGRMKNGAPIPWGNIPARPFLPVTRAGVQLPSNWQRAIERIIGRHMKGALQ